MVLLFVVNWTGAGGRVLPAPGRGGHGKREQKKQAIPLAWERLLVRNTVRRTCRRVIEYTRPATGMLSPAPRGEASREDRLVDHALDVGQPHVAAGVAVGQARDRGRAGAGSWRAGRGRDGFSTARSRTRRSARGDPPLHAAAGQPDGETLGVVVAAVGVLPWACGRTRRPRSRASRRAGPALKGPQESGDGPVDGPHLRSGRPSCRMWSLSPYVSSRSARRVREPAREQAAAAKIGGLRVVQP